MNKKIFMVLVMVVVLGCVDTFGQTFQLSGTIPVSNKLEDNIVVENSTPYQLTNIAIYNENHNVVSYGYSCEPMKNVTIMKYWDDELKDFSGKDIYIDFECEEARQDGYVMSVLLYEKKGDVRIGITRSNRQDQENLSERYVRMDAHGRINGHHLQSSYANLYGVKVSERLKLKDNIVVQNSSPYSIEEIVVYYGNTTVAGGSDIKGYGTQTIMYGTKTQLQEFNGQKLDVMIVSPVANMTSDELYVECTEKRSDLLIVISSKKEKERLAAAHEEYLRKLKEQNASTSSSSGGFLDAISGLMNVTQKTVDLVNQTRGKSSSSSSSGNVGSSSSGAASGNSSSSSDASSPHVSDCSRYLKSYQDMSHATEKWYNLYHDSKTDASGQAKAKSSFQNCQREMTRLREQFNKCKSENSKQLNGGIDKTTPMSADSWERKSL